MRATTNDWRRVTTRRPCRAWRVALSIPIGQVVICADYAATKALGFVLEGSTSMSAAAADAACRTRDPIMRLKDIPKGVSLEEYLCYVCAGAAAERVATGEARPDAGWSDRFTAEALIAEATRVEAWRPYNGPPLRMAEARAETAVKFHWSWIERTATALVRKGRLTGDEVRDLRNTKETR